MNKVVCQGCGGDGFFQCECQLVSFVAKWLHNFEGREAISVSAYEKDAEDLIAKLRSYFYAAEPVKVSLEKCARAACYADDCPPDAFAPEYGDHGDLVPCWKLYIDEAKAALDAAKQQGVEMTYDS